MNPRLATAGFLMGLLALTAAFGPAAAQRGDELEQMRRAFSERNDAALAEPYRGITSGSAERNLFPIRATGVSTEPVRRAAQAFLAALTPEQRARTAYRVDDVEWRKWANQDIYLRQGVRTVFPVARPRAVRVVLHVRTLVEISALRYAPPHRSGKYRHPRSR